MVKHANILGMLIYIFSLLALYLDTSESLPSLLVVIVIIWEIQLLAITNYHIPNPAFSHWVISISICFLLTIYSIICYGIELKAASISTTLCFSLLLSFRLAQYTLDPAPAHCFALLCCWLSSVVYILDWGKSWQEWPIPSLLGFIIGSLVENMWCIVTSSSSKCLQ